MALYDAHVNQLMGEFENLNPTNDERLVDWLARMFEVARNNDLDTLPRRDIIAKTIKWTRNLPESIVLPDEPPNYKSGDAEFATWLIAYACVLADGRPSALFPLDAQNFWHLAQAYLGMEE